MPESLALPVLPLIDSVRQAVLAGFDDLGQLPGSPELLRESILIRDGYYAGRRFSCGDLSAVWCAQRGQIVFFAGSSRIRVVPVETSRKAA